MEPLARIELNSNAPVEVRRLLPLVGLDPVCYRNANSPPKIILRDASVSAIRVDFGNARERQFAASNMVESSSGSATITIPSDCAEPPGVERSGDLVTDSAVAAVCFILSRALGLTVPFLTTDPHLFEVIRAAIGLGRKSARVLVEGEVGVGKKSLIKLIHAAGSGPSGLTGDRERSGLVHAECAGLEADAVETEVGPLLMQVAEFNRSHEGGGAIFFNRIGELKIPAQRKLLDLLRAFDGRELDRTQLPFRMCILAASTKPLSGMFAEGSSLPGIRDLFDATLTISPLRVRRGDLSLLVRHYLRCLNSSLTLNAAALRALSVYPFPGNTLELVNLVTRVAITPFKSVPKTSRLRDRAIDTVGRAEVISQLDCGGLSLVRRPRLQRDYRLRREPPRTVASRVESGRDGAMLEKPARLRAPELALPVSLRLTTGVVAPPPKPRSGGRRPLI